MKKTSWPLAAVLAFALGAPRAQTPIIPAVPPAVPVSGPEALSSPGPTPGETGPQRLLAETVCFNRKDGIRVGDMPTPFVRRAEDGRLLAGVANVFYWKGVALWSKESAVLAEVPVMRRENSEEISFEGERFSIRLRWSRERSLWAGPALAQLAGAEFAGDVSDAHIPTGCPFDPALR